VAVTSEESYNYLDPHKVVVTGYPVRSEIFSLDRAQARQSLALDPQAQTLLVFGGSRGARSINQALVAGLRDLLLICQIVHISGRLDAEWVAGVARSLPEALRARYHHYIYLHEMSYALAAADLAVTRAGAAILGELPAVGLPGVLIPYPHSGQHQLPNAEHLAQHGAARVLPDHQLGERLVPTLIQLLEDPDELARMRTASRAMARPDAAEAIARHIFLVARGQPLDPTGEPS
jgi:UDP-N-acetylglucosamine--N-acetylmuramyl-(pentapeptide) pyrophosphoryl-undecaprenol N-acetylglucosamine transferase